MLLSAWFLPGFFIFIVTVDSRDPEPIEFSGQVNIALLLDLHSQGQNQNPCGELKLPSVQQMSAGLWAVQLLNNQSETGATKIGIVIYDTCQSTEVALRHVQKLIRKEEEYDSWNCSERNDIPLLGVIAVGERSIIIPVAHLLNAFSIPLVVASSGGADSLSAVKNVLYTAPEMASQVKLVLGLVRAFQWRLVRVISSSSSALQEFLKSTQEQGIRVTHQIQVTDSHLNVDIDYLLEKPIVWPLVIVAFLEPEELKYLSKRVSRHSTKHLLWVIASPSLDRHTLPDYVLSLGSGIFIEPHSPEMAGFQQFHSTLMAGHEILDRNFSLLKEYKSFTNSCSTSKGSSNCHQNTFHQVPGVAHITEAVSALAAALRIVTLDNCHQAANCSSVQRPLARMLLGALKKLSFSFIHNQPPELQGSRLRFTDSGRLVTVHSHIIYFNSSHSPILIGWYSEELGVSLVSLPGSLIRTQLDSTEYQHMWAERVAASYNQSSSILTSPNEDAYGILVQHVSHGASVRRAWAAAVLALSCIGVLATGYILIYLLLRSCNHQSISIRMILDFALLFSIALLYAICVLFVLPPSETLCRWRLISHSAGHSLCYSLLLVQAMALKSEAKLGLGGSLSHPVSWMTLILAVTPQMTVTFQWLLKVDSLTKLSAFSSSLRCSIPNTTFIMLHVPAMFLLITTILFSVPLPRKCRANESESRWIFLATIVCIPVWLGWGIVTNSASMELQEPAACAHLLTVATVVALSIFVPKMRILSQQMASFRHKKLNSPTSASTVFSIPQESPSIRFSVKSLRGNNLPTHTENVLQSPVYETFNRRLTGIPEKNEK